MTFPNPSHSGQAPSGLLKLYSRGSGAGYSMPQSSQANCVPKPIRRQGLPSISSEGREERGEGRGLGTSVTGESPDELVTSVVELFDHAQHRPRPLVNAVSSESRSRLSAALPATSDRR